MTNTTLQSIPMIDLLYKLFLNELDSFVAFSYFAHQSMHNIKDSGGLIELALRKFLREIIGNRFRITHGYICVNGELSPQIDIMIIDTFISCHSLKCFKYLDNLEIVPIEAVVAIFEIKRTLNAESLKSSTEHLHKIFCTLPSFKNHSQRYLPSGMTIEGSNGIEIDGGNYSNPLIGVIGLGHDKLHLFNLTEVPWFIDIIFSTGGILIAPEDADNNFKIIPSRNSNDPISFKKIEKTDEIGRVRLLKIFVCYLIGYLNAVGGRPVNMKDYLFHSNYI